jgi:hypothetical protein
MRVAVGVCTAMSRHLTGRTERLLALLCGLVSGLLIGGAVGYIVGAGVVAVSGCLARARYCEAFDLADVARGTFSG